MQRLQISRYNSTKISSSFMHSFQHIQMSILLASLSSLQPDVPIPVVITAYADKTFDYVGLLIIWFKYLYTLNNSV